MITVEARSQSDNMDLIRFLEPCAQGEEPQHLICRSLAESFVFGVES